MPSTAKPTKATPDPRPKVPQALDRMAAYAWRIIVIAMVTLAGLWVLRQARVVFYPIVVAVFATRALSPIMGWLCRHRWRRGFAAAVCTVGFIAALVLLVTLVGQSVSDELDSIGPTLTEAVDEVEDWVVEDAPFDVSRETAERFRERISTELENLVESDEGVADRATFVAEILTGTFLALMLTFFMLRDGHRFADWVASMARRSRETRVRESLDAAWSTLAAYLRGSALLGLIEATAMGITLWIVGASLIVPVMILTLLGPFVPVVGAIVAGLIAVLVALVTAGTGAAITVAIVALVVQQFDNDLLAPIIFGRALKLHPVVILLSVVAGGALFGLVGTILSVPVVAVTTNAVRVYNATPEVRRSTAR